MKVLMLNGSRRADGCTYTALSMVAESLKENGVDSEIVHVGGAAMDGTIDAQVKAVAEKLKTCDGLVLGSPVYYSSPTGEMIAFLDRLFWTAENDIRFKPGAAVVSARRAGTTSSLDVLNKYLTYCQMPVVTSRYWNMVHGNTPDEVRQDAEGIQIMRTLGRNMAWILKSIEAGRQAGVPQPQHEKKLFTNFIR